ERTVRYEPSVLNGAAGPWITSHWEKVSGFSPAGLGDSGKFSLEGGHILSTQSIDKINQIQKQIKEIDAQLVKTEGVKPCTSCPGGIVTTNPEAAKLVEQREQLVNIAKSELGKFAYSESAPASVFGPRFGAEAMSNPGMTIDAALQKAGSGNKAIDAVMANPKNFVNANDVVEYMLSKGATRQEIISGVERWHQWRMLTDRTVEPGAAFSIEMKITPSAAGCPDGCPVPTGRDNVLPEKLQGNGLYSVKDNLYRAATPSEALTPSQALSFFNAFREEGVAGVSQSQYAQGGMTTLQAYQAAVEQGIDFSNLQTRNADGTWIQHNAWSFSYEVEQRTGLDRQTAFDYFALRTSRDDSAATVADRMNRQFEQATEAVSNQGWNIIAAKNSVAKTYAAASAAYGLGVAQTKTGDTNLSGMVVAEGYKAMPKLQGFNENAPAEKFLTVTAQVINSGVNYRVNNIGSVGHYLGVSNVAQTGNHYGSVTLPDGSTKYLFTDGGMYKAFSALAANAGVKQFDGWFANNVADPLFTQGRIATNNVNAIQAAWGNPFEARQFNFRTDTGNTIAANYTFNNVSANQYTAHVDLTGLTTPGGQSYTLGAHNGMSPMILGLYQNGKFSGQNYLVPGSDIGSAYQFNHNINGEAANFNGFKTADGVTKYVERVLPAGFEIQGTWGKSLVSTYTAKTTEAVFIGFLNKGNGDFSKIDFVSTPNVGGVFTQLSAQFSNTITKKCESGNCGQNSGLHEQFGPREGTLNLQIAKNGSGIDVWGTTKGIVVFGEQPPERQFSGFSPATIGMVETIVVPKPEGGKPSPDSQSSQAFWHKMDADKISGGQIGFIGQINISNPFGEATTWMQPSLGLGSEFHMPDMGLVFTVESLKGYKPADLLEAKQANSLPWGLNNGFAYSNVVFEIGQNGQIRPTAYTNPKNTQTAWE
ncbi:MAG: hypothetical protein NTY99_03820, partial [DPANN group archaeon]|nr:hypothetical protein [DPANN group archaeon]